MLQWMKNCINFLLDDFKIYERLNVFNKFVQTSVPMYSMYFS